jgi:hypothetical protein
MRLNTILRSVILAIKMRKVAAYIEYLYPAFSILHPYTSFPSGKKIKRLMAGYRKASFFNVSNKRY